MYKLINFTELLKEQKIMVFKWRNDERVFKFMKTKSISLKSHLKFLKSLKNDATKRYFLVKNSDTFLGVISFINITNTSCEFGVYANPGLKGQGNTLMIAILDYAFCVLCVKSLNATAYIQNKAAIDLYKKFGFEIYKQDSEFLYLTLTNNKI
ncbi:UDP-4-amino-4,6-dideoxy-N-acetyl-beta-L-altrosamine N-acetyltransferase [Campylobacter mucosalis]|uniref:UDP-4-amino-4, 6-dideoxy-N-acetyl-beta-L-altrosamine N-acetyltransferase n=1 Tax=Campylobacter mucosalis TaxID=202 RepID=UPI0014704E23|nr:UDP-4-amino-4,6-dideoxy-N-acetyl-beta-L-altrosamine N-acetyltransferase [Campylobacter mucosalis]